MTTGMTTFVYWHMALIKNLNINKDDISHMYLPIHSTASNIILVTSAVLSVFPTSATFT
jgi:hypothetical protein